MNNKKNHTHTHTPTHISKTIENIIYIYTYKFNKAKSSCKLKTYTHVIVLAKKATIHVCSVAQVHSTSNRIYCPKMLIHVEVLSFNFHWKCKHMAILFILTSMVALAIRLTHITKKFAHHAISSADKSLERCKT